MIYDIIKTSSISKKSSFNSLKYRLFKNACSAGSTPPIGKILFFGQALL